MRLICYFLFIFGFSLLSYSQKSEDSLMVYNKLKSIKNVPFDDIGDNTYWDLVKGGLNNIPVLMNFLDNPEETGILVMNLNPSTIADLAYNIIENIIYNMPTFELIEKAGGCIQEEMNIYYYKFFLDGNNKNRYRFKETVKKWYFQNNSNLIWITTDNHKYSDFVETNPFKNPAGGYYIFKNQE